MTYSSVIEYLYGLQTHGIKLGLHTMHALLGRVGNPQQRFRAFHIGGTNGKGSTAAMTASILQHSGLRVGLYTSPHLVDFRERMCVNGSLISEECVIDLVCRLRRASQDDLHPTFFELTTAMALLHFAESGVDTAVLEVGMGGRFDATNVIERPLACAVTTIGLDHQEYLGPTEQAIAYEKGGIIKPTVPIIIGRMGEEAKLVLRRIASDRLAPVWELDRDFSIDNINVGSFAYHGVNRIWKGLTCRLEGRHQLDNAACALALLDAASGAETQVTDAAVPRGLQAVSWQGRLERVQESPMVLLDGAHNPHAALVLADYFADFRARHPNARIILVWGMMRDKDHRGFIAPLFPLVSEIVLTQAEMARSAPVQALRDVLPEGQVPIQESVLPADALAVAKARAKAEDLICVAGSLMLVGDIKAALLGCGMSPIRG